MVIHRDESLRKTYCIKAEYIFLHGESDTLPGKKTPAPNIEKETDLVESSFKPKKSDGNGA